MIPIKIFYLIPDIAYINEVIFTYFPFMEGAGDTKIQFSEHYLMFTGVDQVKE